MLESFVDQLSQIEISGRGQKVQTNTLFFVKVRAGLDLLGSGVLDGFSLSGDLLIFGLQLGPKLIPFCFETATVLEELGLFVDLLLFLLKLELQKISFCLHLPEVAMGLCLDFVQMLLKVVLLPVETVYAKVMIKKLLVTKAFVFQKLILKEIIQTLK